MTSFLPRAIHAHPIRALALLLVALLLAPASALAQGNPLRFINLLGGDGALAVDEDALVYGDASDNVWVMEAGEGFLRIKNEATGHYLHTENGLGVGPAEPGWWSAMWTMLPSTEYPGWFRFHNRWTQTYLKFENGTLGLGALDPQSTVWNLRTASGPQWGFEISHTVSDLVETLKGVSADASTVIDTEVDDFEDTYFTGNDITINDHPSGITMTNYGRIVTTMSRTGSDSDCGVLIYSDPYVPGRDITWHSECVIAEHPSAIQATGEVVAVADDRAVKFFLLPTHYEPFRKLEHLNVRSSSAVEAVGVTYNHGNDQFYLVYSDGGVTPNGEGATQTVQLCNTDPGKSLLDPNTAFRNCRSVPNVKMSGQGAHLISDDNDVLYVVSTFSSTEDPDQLRDGSKCADDILGFSDSDFADILVVTKLESTSSGIRGVEVYNAPVGTTQSQCIANRPSWRYGGAVAATSENELTALWAGRLFTDVAVGSVDLHAGFNDDFEVAMQTLTSGSDRRAAVNESCDSNSDCANGACGRPHANDAPKVCCASGDTVNHGGFDYCTGLPNDTSCWLDSMCSSDSCSGNLYGAQRGTCD